MLNLKNISFIICLTVHIKTVDDNAHNEHTKIVCKSVTGHVGSCCAIIELAVYSKDWMDCFS